MKLSLAALVVSAPAATAYTVGGFDTFGRPYFVAPRQGRNRRPFRDRRCSPGRDCVDQAFEDLKNELNQNDRFRPRGNTRSPDYFKMNEEAIRQQEEWVKRAFGLASEVAKGMATSPQEAKNADEAIRQSKEFVDNIFGFAKDASSGRVYSFVQSEVLQDDDKVFQVSFDVPGVQAQDIEVTVEGSRDKILVVRGKRMGGREQARKFSKVITLDPRSDTQKLLAELENGVLLVTVPRLPIEKPDIIQKISVSSQAPDESQEDSQAHPFELEIDVPGCSASNIDIKLEGDTDRTLTITAVRELGTDSEGNPRTKETVKSFKVDELVDTSKIVANLTNGVLKVSAPADAKKTEETVRKIDVIARSVEPTKGAFSNSEQEEKEDFDVNNDTSK